MKRNAHDSGRCLFHRRFDFQRVGFFSRVCIDIEGAPEVCSLLVGRVKIDADIRRLAFGNQCLLECCGKAFAGRVDGVDHEVLVACIRIDKVEGVTRIVLLQRKVADGVIENDGRRCLTFPRAREEKGEMKGEQDGNKVSGMIHYHVQIIFCVKKRREGANMHLLNSIYYSEELLYRSRIFRRINNLWITFKGTCTRNLPTSNPSK